VEAARYVPRLLQLKGKRHVRLREVPCTIKSVNSGDVFILDLGLTLIQFNGKASAPLERSRAAEICRAIDTERQGKPVVVVFEEGDRDAPKEWAAALGGTGPIASAAAGGDDLAFERQPSGKVLVRLSDAGGKLTMTRVAEGAAVTRKALDSNDVFIVDVGNEVFAWIGAKASAGERRTGMRFAEMYLKEAGKPVTLPISRVLEGAENDYFLKLLAN
jgi:gelsolin